MQVNVILISYIISAILFIVGIKKLGKVNTARQGNFLSAVGMLIAILATLFKMDAIPLNWVLGGIALGTVIGAFSAIKVAMTAMPQMVSLFNGMGGACSAFIGLIEFQPALGQGEPILVFATVLGSLVVGTITFSGSMIAFAKLNGNMNKDIRLPYYNIINTLFLIAISGLSFCLLMHNILSQQHGLVMVFHFMEI